MSTWIMFAVGVIASSVGLWLHDWRSLVCGGVCFFAAWLLHDVDSCIARSEPEPAERLNRDLLARTVSATKGMSQSDFSE